MSAIKPGSLCVIVGTDSYQGVVGRVCTAVRIHKPGMWEIEASWLREPLFQALLRDHGGDAFGVLEKFLRPIDDPSSATNSYYTMVVHV